MKTALDVPQTRALSEVKAICASAAFARAPALGRLLTFLVEHEQAGHADLLRETYIGVEFFQRGPRYDPKIDAVVRVNAGRLRTRLDAYYAETTGAACRITLPKGSYVPTYESLAWDSPVEESPAESSGSRPEPELPRAFAPAVLPVRQTAGRGVMLPWVVAGLGVAGMLLLSSLLLHRTRDMPQDANWTVRPFARFGGSQQFSDFSPDGRSMVFASSDLQSPRRNIYIQELASDTPRRLTNDPEEETRPVWSPDGRRVAFLKLHPAANRDVMTVDVATGAQTRIATLAGTFPWLCGIARLSWTPDGKTVVSSSTTDGGSTCGLVAIDVQQGTVRPLVKPVQGTLGDLEASVSPDGRSVAFLRNTSFAVSDLFIVGLDGRGLRQITHDLRDILGFCWGADGRSVVVASNRGDGLRRLWQVSTGKGDTQALTSGANAPMFPALARSGDRMAFTQFETTDDLWKQTSGKSLQLTENEGVNGIPAISPDGKRLAFDSTRSGAYALWISDADGRSARKLSQDGSAVSVGSPAWSPDGKRLVVECLAAGVHDVCVIDADGTHLKRLTSASSDQILPSWSHDGQHVYYASAVTGRYEIYRLNVGNGPPLQITHGGGKRAVESADGKTLFVHRGNAGGLVALPVDALEAGPAGVERVASAEGKVLLLAELGPLSSGDWQPTGSELVFLEAPQKRLSPVFSFRTADGRLRELGEVDASVEDGVLNLAVAPDGNSIYYRKQRSSTDLSLMVSRTKR